MGANVDVYLFESQIGGRVRTYALALMRDYVQVFT